MKTLAVALALALIAVTGWSLQSPPYRLDRVGQPADQAALAHRDSAYASATWVVSESENFMQLRFFERNEGSPCLRPSWDDLQELAKTKPTLSHLVPERPITPNPGDATWPHDWLPNPGTVSHTKYNNLFPVGILLNDRLCAGDPREAPANVAVIGLGSGVGLAVLAHHFPNISITVIDIDQAVIDLVDDHYPLLHWLSTQKTADGRPRLRFVALDARQYIQVHAESSDPRFDLIILDAYTSGSTIPPHLMTREFFAECAAALTDDGILLGNIIGSYGGGKTRKHLVLGGAIKAMIAAGLEHVHNFPILRMPGDFKATENRNNMVVASRVPLDLKTRAAAWQRLRDFVLYPELDRGNPAYISRVVALFRGNEDGTASVPAEVLDLRVPRLRARLGKNDRYNLGQRWLSNDPGIIKEVADAVVAAYTERKLPVPAGWRERSETLVYLEYDWIDHARSTWNEAIQCARQPNQHDGAILVSGPRPLIQGDVPLFTDARPNADIFNSGD